MELRWCNFSFLWCLRCGREEANKPFWKDADKVQVFITPNYVPFQSSSKHSPNKNFCCCFMCVICFIDREVNFQPKHNSITVLIITCLMIFSEDYQIRGFCLTVKISSLGVAHNVENIGCFHCPSGVNIMPPAAKVVFFSSFSTLFSAFCNPHHQ